MRKLFLCVLLLATLFVFSLPSFAQGRSLYWERLDVYITVLPNSDIRVEEVWEVVFQGGPFRFGYRNIPMKRLTDITEVQVEGDGRLYSLSDSERPFTFKTFKEEGDFIIKWFFPPISDERAFFRLSYTVKGALRFYKGGDQLWWVAVFPDRNYPVKSSTVTVYLPAGARAEKIASYGPSAVGEISSDGKVVTFKSQETIGPGESLEVRVQFPHGIVTGSPALWQRLEDMRPVANLLLGAMGLLLAVGGIVLVIALWYFRGRDVPVGEVASYLPEPPSDLPPALAGTLLDEQADLQDIIATLVDLARKGAIEIVEKIGPLGSRTITFRLKDRNVATHPFEARLISAIFGSDRTERSLGELKDQFYIHIPELQKIIYNQAVRQNLFPANPQRVRTYYQSFGLSLIALAFILGVFVHFAFNPLFAAFETAVCPFIGLGVTGLALMYISRFMPRKTRKGSQEAAQWRAFKRYLQNIEKYTKLTEAKYIFERYLPYAIAFGLERSWIYKFAQADAPAPPWYIPDYGHTTRPIRVGRAAPIPSSEGLGLPSLESVSQGLFSSLNSISDGLLSTLEAAASTFTSTPSSKGGGWSGGGGGGRGGGGGGGGGFG
ncbi:MAG: DUF2207 domain-containing protein [Anaerolineae bacterium]|nr:DUF2207 domain-containing protein [Anaerolineae bacterium]MDW8103012.1 DUF2207 domain-containing protein [Anaerolineae bacterium]